MNQEIKFRGWQKDGGEGWVEGGIYVTPEFAFIVDGMKGKIHRGHKELTHYTSIVEVHPESVGQYTGLKDKNGKDLNWWQGDILSGVLDSPVSIVFEDGSFYFQSSKSPHKILCSNYVLLDGIKVIGNIHQHPKLIKKKKRG